MIHTWNQVFKDR